MQMVADVLEKLDLARAMTAELQADWRRERADRARVSSREAIARYKAKYPERYQAFHQTNTARRRSQKPVTVEANTFIAFLHLTQTKCPHCFRLLNGKGTLDHIIPLVRGGEHTPNNLILLCLSCNSTKGAKLNWPPAYRFIGRTTKQLSCFD